MSRALTGIVATTDVHSHLDRAEDLAAELSRARPHHLVVDSGDFFEGTGYYRLGGGDLEARLMAQLYDAVVPGNHGYAHYRTPPVAPLVVCANVFGHEGDPVWRTVRCFEVAGQRVAVTGIISASAFSCVPAEERRGHQVVDPVTALARVIADVQAHTWVVLSHSGFAHDVALAQQLPGLDGVIFAGHCHSSSTGPQRAASTLVLKGPELAQGYALAKLGSHGRWDAKTGRFPPPADRGDLAVQTRRILDEIAHLRRSSRIVAPASRQYRNRAVNRAHLVGRLTQQAHQRTGLHALLNETALRPAALGEHVTEWDLAQWDPFDNHLVLADLPQPLTPRTLDEVSADVDRIATAPPMSRPGPTRVVTTAYLATTHLHAAHIVPTGLGLRDLIVSETTTLAGDPPCPS